MCVTMSTRVSSQILDKNEAAYAAFIKEKIEKAGGPIKFQHLTGHLSQLDPSVRQAMGATQMDLRRFLKSHGELFTVDANCYVSCPNPTVSAENTNKKTVSDENSNSSNSDDLFPQILKEVSGIVIKVLPSFGFIAVKKPIKTSVYFTPACYIDKFQSKNEKAQLLTDFEDMLPGKKVLLNARKANTNLEAKYRATRVWTPSNVKNEVLHPDGFHPKVPKDGLYDPISKEGSGKVQKVFEHFGFLTDDSCSENVFFHKTRVCNVENIMNLAKVFNAGDAVEYKAVRSTKKDNNKVKWEATKVWIKKQGKTNLFFEGDSSRQGSKLQQSAKSDPEPDSKSLERLVNEPGKIYPHTNGIVIKFGKHDRELADADSCAFYVHGSKVQDVCWEFSDGDKVTFDGKKMNSAPGWKALLAWVGGKPNVVVHEYSNDERASTFKSGVSDKKPIVPQISQYSKQPVRNYSPEPAIIRPNSASSQISSSVSVSNTYTTVDNDFDLHSEDTMSTVSEDSRTYTSHRNRRRRRRGGNNPQLPVHKSNSYSSLSDDTAFDSGDDSDNNQNTMEFQNSQILDGDKDSTILSQTSVKSSSSYESIDLMNSLKPSFKFTNWGDTPYPAEEDELPHPQAISDFTTENNEHFEKDCLSPVRTKLGKSADQINSLKKFFPSDEEFEDAVQDLRNVPDEVKAQKSNENYPSTSSSNLNDNELAAYTDILNSPNSSKESTAGVKLTPSVKCIYDLQGKVSKVFCKYAEIEHSDLLKEVSVLWSEVYHDGILVADKFDDMKEAIKQGQPIHCNVIEIIDDDEIPWQKVTAAWHGAKPKVKFMTPKEYITQNFLKVSVDEKDYEYVNLQHPSKTLKKTLETPPPKVPPKKFLTTQASDKEESDSDVSLSDTDGRVCGTLNIPVEEIPAENEVDSESSSEGEDDLAENVAKMIMSFKISEDDIKALTSNIINLVRSNKAIHQSEELPLKSLLRPLLIDYCKEDEQTTGSLSRTRKEMTNSQTQTIITGEVIAQSIFTL